MARSHCRSLIVENANVCQPPRSSHGDRIVLDFRADGHVMGSEYRTTTPPTLTLQATLLRHLPRLPDAIFGTPPSGRHILDATFYMPPLDAHHLLDAYHTSKRPPPSRRKLPHNPHTCTVRSAETGWRNVHTSKSMFRRRMTKRK